MHHGGDIDVEAFEKIAVRIVKCDDLFSCRNFFRSGDDAVVERFEFADAGVASLLIADFVCSVNLGKFVGDARDDRYGALRIVPVMRVAAGVFVGVCGFWFFGGLRRALYGDCVNFEFSRRDPRARFKEGEFVAATGIFDEFVSPFIQVEPNRKQCSRIGYFHGVLSRRLEMMRVFGAINQTMDIGILTGDFADPVGKRGNGRAELQTASGGTDCAFGGEPDSGSH